MKSPFLPALLLGMFFLVSCRNNSDNSSPTAGINYKTASLERQSGPGCATEEGACARIEMAYPLAEGADQALVSRINDSIQTTLSQVLFMLNPEGDSLKTLDQQADQFVTSYTDFLKEVPDYEMGWWIEASHEVHLNNSKITSLELMVSSFTGGAHPIGFSESFNFFLPGGEPVLLDSLISDRTAFLQLVEKEFKLSNGLPETAVLQDEGYFYGEAFTLPFNFVFTSEGLYLIYNVYEAAPYAMGPTEFLIPFDKLKDLLRLELILEN